MIPMALDLLALTRAHSVVGLENPKINAFIREKTKLGGRQ
jgi:hypothetical protein